VGARPLIQFPILAAALLRLCCAAVVAIAAVAAAGAQPREVRAGAFVTSVSDIDASEGTFRIAFYAWFHDPAGRFELERDLYIVARSVTIAETTVEPSPDGGTYTFARIEAYADQEFDFRDFPFDRQRLTLRMEASENTDALRFAPDLEDSHVSEYLTLIGWRVEGMAIETAEHVYETNFGYWQGRGDAFAQLLLTVEVARVRSPVFIDDFLGFTFAFVVTALTFVVSCTELGLRVGMTTGSLFAAVTNLVRLDDAVGFKPAFGLVDRLAFLIFGAIVTSLVISLATHRLAKRGDPDRANRLDTALGLTNLGVYLALIAWTMRGAW
jgi:hypothetical protein